MSKPLTPDQISEALLKEGVKAGYVNGWTTHNRNHKGTWGPVNGVMIHHTAGTNSLHLCVKGTAGLPGPLCHAHLSKAGLLTVISSGRANHAGAGCPDVLRAVIRETTLPRPGVDVTDGNSRFYGLEIENRGNGDDPYPGAQYDQAVRWAAALCRAHGWSERSVIGHKEWTRRKIDPSFSMTLFRRAVHERLMHLASWSPDAPSKSKPTPAPTPDPVPPAPKPVPPAPSPRPPAPETVESILRDVTARLERIETLLKGMQR